MTNNLLHWLSDINRFGIRDVSEGEISRRIAFSNVIFISLPVVYLVFIVIDFRSFLQKEALFRFDQIIVPIEICICLFCLWLNKKGFTKSSRLLFLITWPFFLHLIPIYLLRTPIDYYLAFPFGIVFHAMLIQLMISHRKEPLSFWPLLLINFLTLLFTGPILIFFVAEGNQPNEIAEDKYYLLVGLLYWLLFNLVMFYILEVIEKYLKKLNQSYLLIERQRNELKELNNALEDQVKERTLSLLTQNQKLTSYAFYNAHLLRGPFCRIQGLYNLTRVTNNSRELEEVILPKLGESIDELNHVVKQIGLIVNSEKEDPDHKVKSPG